ncbi:MAG: hypothetical protein EWM50_05950 [Gottschalkiaceae bacterium]|nr:MAG: hypothetical protein EWM50_05950 [Gottschalkiaceae bacterium]
MIQLPLVEREEYIKNIDSAIRNVMQTKDSLIIDFYGFGGIGKTYLCEYYKKKTNTGNLVYIFFDFQSFTRGREDVLLSLVKEIINKDNKARFDLFGLAYDKYQELCGTYTKANVKKNFLDSPSISILWKIATAVLGYIPYVGSVVSGVVDKAGELAAEKYFTKNMLLVQEIKKCTRIEDCHRLVENAFLCDYRNNIKERDITYVFFLDTYEYYSRQLDIKKDHTDKWLSALVNQINCQSVWIIFGREKLNWSSVKFYRKYELKAIKNGESFDTIFSNEDIKIEDDNAKEYLRVQSQGIPFALRDYIQEYLSKRESNENVNIEEIKGNLSEVLERMIGDISAGERVLLILLAYAETWNEEELIVYLDTTNTSFADYEKLLKLQVIERNRMDCSLVGIIINTISDFEKKTLIKQIEKAFKASNLDEDERIILSNIRLKICSVIISEKGMHEVINATTIPLEETASFKDNNEPEIKSPTDILIDYFLSLRGYLDYDIVFFENAFFQIWDNLSESRENPAWFHGEIIYRKYLKICGYENKIYERIVANNNDSMEKKPDFKYTIEIFDYWDALITSGCVVEYADITAMFMESEPEKYYYLMLYQMYCYNDFSRTDDIYNEYICYIKELDAEPELYFEICVIYLDVLLKQGRHREEYELALKLGYELYKCYDFDLVCKIREHVILSGQGEPSRIVCLANKNYEDILLHFGGCESHPTVLEKRLAIARAFIQNNNYSAAIDIYLKVLDYIDIASYESVCYKTELAMLYKAIGKETTAYLLQKQCLQILDENSWTGINNLVMLTPNIVELYQYNARQVKPSKSFAKKLYYTIDNAINKYGETNDVIGIFPESLFWRGWIGSGLHIPGYKIDIRKALEKGKALWGENNERFILINELSKRVI